MRLKSRSLGMTLLIFLLAFGTVDCHRQVHVANVPTGVAEKTVADWYAATGAFKIAGERTRDLVKTAVQLHDQFPDEATYQKTLEALGKMQQIEAQAALFLDQQPENWNQPIKAQVQNYVNALSTQAKVAFDDGLFQIKNPTTVAALKVTVNLINGAIQTTITLATQ